MVSFAAPVGAMLPPPTPITKRPTMGLKRDSSFLDTDDEAGLSVNTKRLRFNPEVEIREFGNDGDKPLELVQEEIRTAIDRHLATVEHRDDAPYVKLLGFLSRDPADGDAPSTKLLMKYIAVISARIAVLSECGKLVIATLDLSWLGRDEEFVEIYEKYLILLASTHSKFVSPIMDRLVSHLERLPSSMGRLPYEDPVSRSTMFDRLHTTIENILRRIPSASRVLLGMMRHKFPNDLTKTKSYLQYQRHILQLADTMPDLHTGVIALIMQRLVSIDVQIQRDIEDLEDDAEEQLLQKRRRNDAFGGAEDDDDSDDDSDSETEITATEEEQRLQDLRVKVANMDGTQVILFEHYESAFTADTRPEDNAAYQELLLHFEDIIMRNRSRHAQFLLFHFAQTSPAYAEYFINRCLRTTSDRNAPPNMRLTACAYVASFVARGSRVSGSLIRTTFTHLAQNLEVFRRTYEPQCTGPDRKSYGMYYAIAQALLYIFCFRWRDFVMTTESDMSEEDILAENRDLTWCSDVKETLTRNIYSPLNPLKVCSPHIVGEFAKIANHLRFIYVFSLLERNKRIRLGQIPSISKLGTIDIGRRETAWDRKSGDAHHQLEAYFPFDPYHLPQSKRWIEGEFNEWQLPRGMERDDNEEEEEDDESESEDDYESDDGSITGDLAVQPPPSSGIISISS